MNSPIVNLLGLIGGLFFAYCGVPAAYSTLKAKKHLGTPLSISIPIVAGSIIMYLYLFLAHGFDRILTFNYSVEVLSWSVILWYGFVEWLGKRKST